MALPTIQSLTGDLEHKKAQMVKISDLAKAENDRVFTIDECGVFDKLENECTQLKNQIAAMNADMDRRSKLQAIQDWTTTSSGRIANPDKPGDPNAPREAGPRMTVPASYHRTGALKAFKGPNAQENAYKSGQWFRAAILGDERATYYCSQNGITFRNTLQEGSNPLGGALVPEQMSQSIIDLRETYGVFRQNCEVVPMGSDTMLVPRRLGGMTVYFVGENTEPTASDPTWNSVRLTAKKLAGICKMSSEVDADAIISLADWVSGELAYAFALKEDQCGFNGDGTSTYGGMQGICNYLVAGASLIGAVDATSGHDLFTEVDAGDLSRVMSALPAYARPNAKWYCSSVAMDSVFGRLMSAAGGNTIRDMQAGYMPQYLGYPIVISQVLQTTTSTINDVPMLLFGDLRMSSTLGDRRGISILPTEHRYFELDQIAIRGIERFDIVNHDLGDTVTAGPLVALIGNT